MSDVPPRILAVLSARPRWNSTQLKWERDEKGTVVITHPKNLGRFERWLMKKVGGSSIIRRRLDAPGSDIWEMCDGSHTVAQICDRLDGRYREKIEPVLTRVIRFLEILLARNLIYLQPPEGQSKHQETGTPSGVGTITGGKTAKKTPGKKEACDREDKEHQGDQKKAKS